MHKIIGGLFTTAWVVVFVAAGCTRIPPVQRSTEVSPDVLREHVEFLSQPALEGREPRTGSSRTARQYIVSRLSAYGLHPWGNTNSFEQPFVIGTNIVAVLPGSDPEMSRQFVFLTAHYDHLGRQGFKTFPGACDNASGVATVLEAAQFLAQQSPPPKRSIVFALFDCEESGMLGSLAFADRPDLDPKSIAAVINIDMLGRHTFDLSGEDALVATGTEQYPALRAIARGACEREALNLLPLGRDLVGPRSDHVSFEGLSAAPAVLLSCGPNHDYHQPTDTPDRIDYPLLARHARAATEIVSTLADTSELPTRVLGDKKADRDELSALLHLLERIEVEPESAGISESDFHLLRSVADDARRLRERGNAYSVDDRLRFVASAQDRLLPLLAPAGMKLSDDQRFGALFLTEVYALHPATFSRLQRAVMHEVIARKPDLFHPFGEFKAEAVAVDENSLRLTKSEDGPQRLSLCA
ncbi:MAG TPA: M20/M25/M40 family metallo-hydrolase, partial [Tepidisphaeraceae bacterium]